MAKVVCAGFESRGDAEQGASAVIGAGIARPQVAIFYLTPPRQDAVASVAHPERPDPGPQPEVGTASPGSEEASDTSKVGAGVGAVIGGAIGAAATPLLGPLAIAGGAGIGAYSGSLFGALGGMKRRPAGERPGPDDPSGSDSGLIAEGMRVAVQVDAEDEARIIALLASNGGVHVATVDAAVVDGQLSE